MRERESWEYGEVLIHKTHSCIAPKTVGGTSIGSARGRNTDDGSTHQWCESLLRNTRQTIDQTIEGGKPSP